MAKGDFYGDVVPIANGSSYDIRPASGSEAVIHNLAVSGSCLIKFVKDSSEVTWDSPTGATSYTGIFIHVSYTVFLRITNNSGATIYASWNGIYTK